ncbi:helix-turn-helix domain-containing protein [Sphingomonas alpina]|uniref:Helix-turn-helix transcriptional regulator n=1 Tax=Sphingomonas alpina TaxID=653931 RepID=A0A7H0LGA2_9SPHN|nr:helix-turn-helix transcriptional regulator [Sphingomonas alpina]QNQ08705.1 helix-turn-helix transcriptional regulator [Sphingomonas alpina]
MTCDLPVGRALRRFRRLNGIKQGHAAELLGVSQGSISRWESGAHEPEACHRDRIIEWIAAQANNDADAALKRLVASSTLPVHLVCDATHRLLAASPARAASWAASADELIGQSLWRFASPEIVMAEESLYDRGWFDRPCQQLRFLTGANHSAIVEVLPSLMEWETIPLADGRTGRLTTTIG